LFASRPILLQILRLWSSTSHLLSALQVKCSNFALLPSNQLTQVLDLLLEAFYRCWVFDHHVLSLLQRLVICLEANELFVETSGLCFSFLASRSEVAIAFLDTNKRYPIHRINVGSDTFFSCWLLLIPASGAFF